MNLAMETVKTIVLIVSALFPIVDPLAGSPIFLSLTQEISTDQRWILSRAIAVNSFLLLVGSYFIGTHVLAFFGISLPVVQVGGGLVVVSTGWAMLKRGDDEHRADVQRTLSREDISRRAFYPLTLPLTVGPGSISIAITLGADAPRNYGFVVLPVVAALIGMAAIALSIVICYGFSDRLARILGPTAMSVIIRLSSFLLVCIGIQIMWNGVKALLASVAH
jgi:multiple antibiotic resistance protein